MLMLPKAGLMHLFQTLALKVFLIQIVESSDSDTDSSEDEHDSTAASGATPSDNSLSQNTVGKLKNETELCGKHS